MHRHLQLCTMHCELPPGHLLQHAQGALEELPSATVPSGQLSCSRYHILWGATRPSAPCPSHSCPRAGFTWIAAPATALGRTWLPVIGPGKPGRPKDPITELNPEATPAGWAPDSSPSPPAWIRPCTAGHVGRARALASPSHIEEPFSSLLRHRATLVAVKEAHSVGCAESLGKFCFRRASLSQMVAPAQACTLVELRVVVRARRDDAPFGRGPSPNGGRRRHKIDADAAGLIARKLLSGGRART